MGLLKLSNEGTRSAATNFPLFIQKNDNFTVTTSINLDGFVGEKFKKRLVRFCDLIPL